MTDVYREFEALGEIINFHRTGDLFEVKMKLKEDIKKKQIDVLCTEYVEPIYPTLIYFDIQGLNFKCAYTIYLE